MFAVVTDTAGETFGELFDKADHYSDHSPDSDASQLKIISVTRIRSNASLL